jgi:Tfp pilus assembly protein PilW
MNGDINQRGITITELAVVLFIALLLATNVTSLVIASSLSFWSMIANS